MASATKFLASFCGVSPLGADSPVEALVQGGEEGGGEEGGSVMGWDVALACEIQIIWSVAATAISMLLCGHRMGQVSCSLRSPSSIWGSISATRKVQAVGAAALLVCFLARLVVDDKAEAEMQLAAGMMMLCWAGIAVVMYAEDGAGEDRGWQLKSMMLLLSSEGVATMAILAVGMASGAVSDDFVKTKRFDLAIAILTTLLGASALLQRPKSADFRRRRGHGMAASRGDGAYNKLLEEKGGEGTELKDVGAKSASAQEAPSRDPPKSENPEEHASWAEEWIFSWISPTLSLGSKQNLELTNLPTLRGIDTSEAVCARLISAWSEQLLLPSPSLFWALHSVFGGAFWTCALHKMSADVLAIASPMILQQMLKLLEGEGGASSSYMDCVILAVLLFLAKMCFSVLWNQYFHRLFRIGWQMRSALSGLVYRKTLSMSSRSIGEHPLGDIVSLVSLDSQRLGAAMGYLHYLWSSPFLIILSVWMLYDLLGNPALSGLAFMAILTPANIHLAKAMENLNGQLMKTKDRRASLLDETLQSIRMIKLFAWESSFMERVSMVREEEIGLMKKEALLYIGFSVMWTGSNILVALVTFAVYTWSGAELKPNIAFPALALFNILRGPMAALPGTINMAIDCRTSLRRLITFLTSDEVDPGYHSNGRTQEKWFRASPGGQGVAAADLMPFIRISSGEFVWPQQRERDAGAQETASSGGQARRGSESRGPWTLTGVDMHVNARERVFVAGPVGAGKSSLLLAILGGIGKSRGTVELRGRVAYVPQQPWIYNATLRENILFGMAYDAERYNRVVEACALLSDFDVLPDGDQTEIGEKGINLSGGQKARVSLARACYQEADVYLLDDPLAAVDVHVARQLMDECILGILKDRAVVLVTHQIQFLPLADKVVVIKDGRMAACGSFKSVSGEHPDLIHALETAPPRDGLDGKETISKDGDNEELIDGGGHTGSVDAGSKPDSSVGDKGGAGQPSETVGKGQKDATPSGKSILIQDEKMETGTVSTRIWVSLAKCIGSSAAFIIVCLFFSSQMLQTGSDAWLSVWSSAVVDYDGRSGQVDDGTVEGNAVTEFDTNFYLQVYAFLSLATVAALSLSSYTVVTNLLRASRNLHEQMLRRIMYAPTKFFDSTPLGRILNRFTGDINEIDKELRRGLEAVFVKGMKLVFVLVVVLYVTPYFAAIVALMSVVYFYVQRFYRQTSRQLSRIETVSKSHIISLVSETVSGQGSIRAFEAQGRFVDKFNSKCDDYTLAYATSNTANRWLQIRLEFIGNVSVGFSALLAVLGSSSNGAQTAGLVGLSITYALDVTESLNWVIRNFTVVEKGMVSAERIDEYTHGIENEVSRIPGQVPDSNWPSQGVLEFRDVVMRYRDDLPPALKGVSFKTAPREKLGVVGRTGAGKSSLAVAIWRMTEISEGCILLDGVDTRIMGTCDLRERLSIIPQDPIIFSGTVRTNVDPLGVYSDKQVWDALERVQFKSFMTAAVARGCHGDKEGGHDDAEGLHMAIQSGGVNLSAGQRQLLCLARALVRSSRLILIDEATASVDMNTDTMIQKTIKECFNYATVLTIAHRIATVMECDRVLVMSESKVAECGNPHTLQSDPSSLFCAMTTH